MKNKYEALGSTYSIRVKETIMPNSLDWFSDLTITPLEDGSTLLIGWFPDQPALRGLFEYLWNLNFSILSLESMDK